MATHADVLLEGNGGQPVAVPVGEPGDVQSVKAPPPNEQAGKVYTDPTTGKPIAAPGKGGAPQVEPSADTSTAILARNPYGQHGAPDHRATVDRLEELARREYPDAVIVRGRSIKDATGGEVNRRPDVTVLERGTGRVLKVYEAARTQKDGTFVERERAKEKQYDQAGIPSHFEPVKP